MREGYKPRPIVPKEPEDTRPAYIYVVPGEPKGIYGVRHACKIGSTFHPETRPRHSSKKTPVLVMEVGWRKRAYRIEYLIHEYMEAARVPGTKEWFWLTQDMIDEIERIGARRGASVVSRAGSVSVMLLSEITRMMPLGILGDG